MENFSILLLDRKVGLIFFNTDFLGYRQVGASMQVPTNFQLKLWKTRSLERKRQKGERNILQDLIIYYKSIDFYKMGIKHYASVFMVQIPLLPSPLQFISTFLKDEGIIFHFDSWSYVLSSKPLLFLMLQHWLLEIYIKTIS